MIQHKGRLVFHVQHVPANSFFFNPILLFLLVFKYFKGNEFLDYPYPVSYFSYDLTFCYELQSQFISH